MIEKLIWTIVVFACGIFAGYFLAIQNVKEIDRRVACLEFDASHEGPTAGCVPGFRGSNA